MTFSLPKIFRTDCFDLPYPRQKDKQYPYIQLDLTQKCLRNKYLPGWNPKLQVHDEEFLMIVFINKHIDDHDLNPYPCQQDISQGWGWHFSSRRCFWYCKSERYSFLWCIRRKAGCVVASLFLSFSSIGSSTSWWSGWMCCRRKTPRKLSQILWCRRGDKVLCRVHRKFLSGREESLATCQGRFDYLISTSTRQSLGRISGLKAKV